MYVTQTFVLLLVFLCGSIFFLDLIVVCTLLDHCLQFETNMSDVLQ